MTFSSAHPSLKGALDAQGYTEPTSVQAAVMEPQVADRDLLVSAQTGSGKTVAYGLTMAQSLMGDGSELPPPGIPMALVVAPTRELAIQVHRELSWLYQDARGRIASCIGGMDPRQESRALAAGCHIVVGTPGRLRDHIERGRLVLADLRVVVLDEADEMLNLGFREDIEFILESMPKTRRTLLFSATIPPDISALAKRYQSNSLRIDTIDRSQPHRDIEYLAVRVATNQIEPAIVNLLRFYEARSTMIFCHTREAVRHLHARLAERGFVTVALSGELSQAERNRALQSLREGSARVCVATDVAARGIDLPGLELVIHADLPSDRDTLLHRSGRTGRAGRQGRCVLLVPFNRRRKAESLIVQARIDVIWSSPPFPEDVRQADENRLLQTAASTEPVSDDDQKLAEQLASQYSPIDVARTLVRLYRIPLASAEEVSDWGSADDDRRQKPDRVRPDKRERQKREYLDQGAPTAKSFRPTGPMALFRLNVGRKNNADPKWILPVVCRVGRVQKKDIGSIKIGEDETFFEVTQEVAESFAAAIKSGGHGENVHIQPAAGTLKDIRKSADRLERPPLKNGPKAYSEKPPRKNKKFSGPKPN